MPQCESGFRVRNRAGASAAVCRRPLDGLVVIGYEATDQNCGMAVNPGNTESLSWFKVWELADIGADLGACSPR